MMKHTPTPWYRNIAPATKYNTIWSGRNTHVLRLVVDGLPADEVEANADFILRACNAHYNLMRLLKAAKDYVVEVSSTDEDASLLDEIDAALAAAEASE